MTLSDMKIAIEVCDAKMNAFDARKRIWERDHTNSNDWTESNESYMQYKKDIQSIKLWGERKQRISDEIAELVEKAF